MNFILNIKTSLSLTSQTLKQHNEVSIYMFLAAQTGFENFAGFTYIESKYYSTQFRNAKKVARFTFIY